jgi:hypothetical protein
VSVSFGQAQEIFSAQAGRFLTETHVITNPDFEESMKWCLTLAVLAAALPAGAQTLETSVGVSSAYMWRGLSLDTRPVVQPAVTAQFGRTPFSVGAAVTLESVAFGGLADFSVWWEAGVQAGPVTLAVGAAGLLETEAAASTVEAYAMASLPVTGSLTASAEFYRDVRLTGGVYAQADLVQEVTGTPFSVSVGAGWSAGQSGVGEYFGGSGFTHVQGSFGYGGGVGPVAVELSLNGQHGIDSASPRRRFWLAAEVGWSVESGR